MKASQRRFIIGGLLALVTSLAGCGEDAETVTVRGGDAPPPAAATDRGSKGTKGKPLVVYQKVAPELRKELARGDFLPDPMGETNRDPYRSYLIQSMTPKSTLQSSEDECAKRTIAPKFELRDLKLAGIVMRGTKSYALFIDRQQLGYMANRGDCVSKDKVRLKDIGSDRVILEVRGEAPPGAPAPPPRDEVWKLHPSELELSDEQLNPTLKKDGDAEIGSGF